MDIMNTFFVIYLNFTKLEWKKIHIISYLFHKWYISKQGLDSFAPNTSNIAGLLGKKAIKVIFKLPFQF
jgi:hypothetical protein